ncbi:hypothetical protein [Paenibacillus luteus]|uniref:hypothetical protein n=1 Tax=Paenibacillus luteus TaxID=2545753 RepID=UPI0019D5AFF4|nr:hypothetical protein [Paenibacillus luteus]
MDELKVKQIDAQSETSVSNDLAVPTDASSVLLKYQNKDGWTIQYPKSWDKITDNTLQESATEKYISFRTYPIPDEGVETWLDNKIEKSLSFEEADNKLIEDITTETKGDFVIYRYVLQSSYVEPTNTSNLKNIFYVGNGHIYEFHGQTPPLAKEEFETIVDSFAMKIEVNE